jgi:branched-chain amino acid transport system substrate-binding protein
MREFSIVAVVSAVLFCWSVGAAAAEDGVYPDRIVVGQSSDYSKGLAPIVKELTAGAKSYLDWINANGGVHGRKIVIESLDDSQDPKRVLENTKKLVQDTKVFCLFLYRGTPQTESVMPLLTEFKIPLIGPSTGAQTMYSPPKRYLFPVRASYHSETEEIVNHLVSTGATKIAVIRDDSSFGQDGFSGFEVAMKKRGLAPHAVATFPRGTTQIEEAAKKLSDSEPQAIVMVTPPNAAGAFVKKMKTIRDDVLLFALSNVSSAAFVKDVGAQGHGVVVAQVAPAPLGYSSMVSRELQQIGKSNAQTPLSYSALEGMLSAKVLVEGLRRAGREPTREKLVSALESLQRFDLGGVDVTYGPQSRAGSRYVELTIIGRDGKFIR